jgi:DNA polymerase-4
MDAFFASVEQAVNPALRGKPVIVGSRGRREHTVVAACSYEAKAYGISSGMPTFMAFKLCPHARFVTADSGKYLDTSSRIEAVLQEYTDRIEAASIDEFYLDLTDLGAVCAVDACRDIKRRIKDSFGLTCSAGIAPNRIVAKIAAKSGKPDGLVAVKPQDVSAFMENLSIEKIPGIGPQSQRRLNMLSVFTCGELAQFDARFLEKRFGKYGLWLAQVSRGIDSDEVRRINDPDPAAKSVSHSYTLEREIYSRPLLESWLRMLTEMVAYRLRKERLDSRTVHVYMHGSFGVFAKQKSFGSATHDPAALFQRVLAVIDSFGGQRLSAKAIGVAATGLTCLDDLHLFPSDQKKERLLGAIDTINARFGEWSVYPASVHTVK